MKRIYVSFALKGHLRGQIVEGRFTPMTESLDHWARCKIANSMGVAIRTVSVQSIILLSNQMEVA